MRARLITVAIFIGLFAAAPVAALKVYKTKSEGLADVKVYETNSQGLADCLVYVTSSEGLADGNAKWYFVNSEGLADVKIHFVQSEGLADKKIYFTKSAGLAKCEVDWKGYKKSMARRFCDSDFGPFTTSLIRDMALPLCNQQIEFQPGESN
jgi:Family of unknown function (DUF6150)